MTDDRPPKGAPRPGAKPLKDIVRKKIVAELDQMNPSGSLLLSDDGGKELLLSAVKEREVDPDKEKAVTEQLLVEARKAIDKLPPDEPTLPGFLHNDSLSLSLVLSQMEEASGKKGEPGKPGVLRDVPGLEQFEGLDPGWAASVVQRLISHRVPFVGHSSMQDFRVPIEGDLVTVAMVGDWGTGLVTSTRIAQQMAALKPSLTIHLGDVYYSGTQNEVKSRFLPTWPTGTLGTFVLNSNHEMYAGGEGYFKVTLARSPFKDHQKASYFCLSLPGWQIIGLDSAYAAPDFLYQQGHFSDEQIQWFRAQLAEGARLNKKSIVLTHHNPVDFKGKKDEGLLAQMVDAAGPQPFHFWYWAHEHVGARFAPFGPSGRQFLGRCVGHGGVPYAPEKAGALANGAVAEWTETQLAGDPEEPRRAKNGFVFLKLDSRNKTLEETFIDEFGEKKITAVY
jgi:hypothetical protein